MLETNNLTLKKFQENFDFIEAKMKDSQIYKDALDSFVKYMPSYAFTDDQKALAYSDFMAKTFLGVFQSAVQTALTIDQNEVATRDAQNQSALGILGKKKEVAMLANQVKESFFKIQASKMQTAQLQAQALQDKIKAEVLHKSANDNAQINKANCMVSYQNVLSNANKPDLLQSYDMQQTTVNALKAIGEAPISDYTDEWKKVQIPDYNTEFDTNIIEVYVTKNIIAVNEIVGFHIVTSIELVEVEWDFGDGEVSTQKDNILKSFSKEGSYNVRLKALVEVENKDYANDKDQDKFVMKEYFRDLEILVC
ncbi:PKD domain-containing protein [Helicobacter trogontum]|uniref:PKD domain-containing protein n=2 Tax=Helicobacter trogontum TaxID=50960 RepID=UPI001F355E9B|nr:PKD domain-containing protein [Helicobacter trogontum]